MEKSVQSWYRRTPPDPLIKSQGQREPEPSAWLFFCNGRYMFWPDSGTKHAQPDSVCRTYLFNDVVPNEETRSFKQDVDALFDSSLLRISLPQLPGSVDGGVYNLFHFPGLPWVKVVDCTAKR